MYLLSGNCSLELTGEMEIVWFVHVVCMKNEKVMFVRLKNCGTKTCVKLGIVTTKIDNLTEKKKHPSLKISVRFIRTALQIVIMGNGLDCKKL